MDSRDSRLQYHPPIDSNDKPNAYARDVATRLRIIETQVDFRGKHVLDLGCSGGYFSLAAAQKAASVTAIDADAELIEKNTITASKLGHTNVEFIHAEIDLDLVRELPSYDIVLFMSVFHHMLGGSDSYSWNTPYNTATLKLPFHIGKLANTYVFEMGEPHESAHWAPSIKSAIGTPREWVPDHVFGRDYERIKVLKGPGYTKLPYSWIPQLYGLSFGSSEFGHKLNRKIKRRANRWLGINWRDFRDIYVGTK